MNAELVPFCVAHVSEALALWRATEGIGVNDRDTAEHLDHYFRRNPGCSFVAAVEGRVVGTILGGSDGRRGYVHHLAVDRAWRGQGLGRRLVEAALAALVAQGYRRCHIFVFRENAQGLDFWRHGGWYERPELLVMTHDQMDP